MAFERIKLGIKNDIFLNNDKAKEIAAYKESCKALIAHIHELLPEVEKLSLFSYGMTEKGKSIFVEQKDRTGYTKEELQLRI